MGQGLLVARSQSMRAVWRRVGTRYGRVDLTVESAGAQTCLLLPEIDRGMRSNKAFWSRVNKLCEMCICKSLVKLETERQPTQVWLHHIDRLVLCHLSLSRVDTEIFIRAAGPTLWLADLGEVDTRPRGRLRPEGPSASAQVCQAPDRLTFFVLEIGSDSSGGGRWAWRLALSSLGQ